MGKTKKKHHVKAWYLCGNTNKHHDLAQCRGGRWIDINIYEWDIKVHEAYHFLFGEMTLLESAEWLMKVDQQKKLDNELDLRNTNNV